MKKLRALEKSSAQGLIFLCEKFKHNEERFEEGKHYFKLDGDALRDFKITNPQIADNLKFAPVIMLWTRRGASRHNFASALICIPSLAK